MLGARQHNLRIDRLEIPKRQMVVLTGVSGSGKSSLAFDTLYAEGQRRYIESLSSYARQFLGQLDRPDVEHLRGLSPTIAIEQKSASNNPRSTVGTITEIYDYLRVLYARVGTQHCHECGKVVQGHSAEEIVREVLAGPPGLKLTMLAPLVVHRKGEFRDLFEELAGRGFLRVRVDGQVHRLDDPPKLDKKLKHDIELVVDRVTVRREDRGRIAESVELALREGKGELWALSEGAESAEGDDPMLRFSENRMCCGHSFPELSPQSFSFNSPLGMCPECNGLGTRMEVDPELVVPDTNLSIHGGAIAPWAGAVDRGEGWTYRIIEAMSEACEVDLDTPWKDLPKRKQQQVLHGLGGKRIRVQWGQEGTESHGSWGMRFEGVIPNLMRRYRQTSSDAAREHYKKFFAERDCDACEGRRLRPESLAVRVADIGVSQVTSMTVSDAHRHFEGMDLKGSHKTIAEGVLREIVGRLTFLLNVGLDYLTLDRSGPTLSGGEAQRIRLASQLGSELSGVMYVLDEPSIGLHQRDNQRLIATLQRLRDLGNSVLVVEHDEETIRAADHVIDFGPGAGHLGGEVVFAGTPQQLQRDTKSLTGQYLGGRRRIELPPARRQPSGAIVVEGAAEHNLREVDVELPLGVLAAVTGVSGAGKSSLINGILLPALSRALHGTMVKVGTHREITGLEALDKVIAIDQKPIGRTPRSNPGTYTKVFDQVRQVFAQLPEAKARGYAPGRFSFNVKGGRCDACEGDGMVKVEMHFLSDVYVPCEVCGGKRYNSATLAVRYKGLNIADVLDQSVDDCLELFANHSQIVRILKTLVDVGLGYMKIGQTAPTMSGGEAQRVKLSRELGKRHTGQTLYLLDEPTTGLHFEDIRKLLGVLQRLVDAGNTVVVIEHNLDVIKCADWIVDLGPEGGVGGGQVVAQGTPEAVAKVKGSYTGQFLAPLLRGTKVGTGATNSKGTKGTKGTKAAEDTGWSSKKKASSKKASKKKASSKKASRRASA
ncbi:excinuclease ABC subunit UvrA [Paraliomyxa miuraensis]|uniref:excinuclease ABC subunit UvrA n=1 Tax=Paraliomyxa miuraensis TaxID=376150 RepID=UPI0022583E4C|nr:excinuclease ABC subunit UvrA [Paraliomyxa miuraensis]MCX4245670.1 excinuclease ABC subunit UvrA [Paraliomyxa miuraensis]